MPEQTQQPYSELASFVASSDRASGEQLRLIAGSEVVVSIRDPQGSGHESTDAALRFRAAVALAEEARPPKHSRQSADDDLHPALNRTSPEGRFAEG